MADIWYYTRGGKQMDPVSMAELRQLAAQGYLKPNDMVWREGMPQWILASAADGIFDEPAHVPNYQVQRGWNGAPAAMPVAAPSRPAAQTAGASGRRYSDTIPSSAARYAPQKGMSTGAKVGIVLGVVLLLAGLGVAAVLLKMNSGGDTPDVARKDKDKDDGKKTEVKPAVVDTYKVFIRDRKEDRRLVELKGGMRYEVTVKANRDCRMDVFVDDEGGKELAKRLDAPTTATLDFATPAAGRYRIEIVNMGIGDADFDVEVRLMGEVKLAVAPPPGPAKLVDSFRLSIKELGDFRRPVNLERGVRYEIRASSDRGCRMEMFLDDPTGKEVAKDTEARGNAKIVYTPVDTGRFELELVNNGAGDSEFNVEVYSTGGAVVGDGKFPFTVDSYEVLVRDGANNIRTYDLQADVRYEITVTSERGVNMNLYLVDDLALDVASDIRPDANCFISWTCNRTGRYKVEVSNQGVGDANAKVLIRAMGRLDPPFKDFPKDFPKIDKAPPPFDKIGGLDKFDMPKDFPKVGVALPEGKAVVPTRGGTRVEESLKVTDSLDPGRLGRHCKVYQMKLEAGKAYTFDMMAAFDTFIRLVDAGGKELMFNDDGGEGLNSRMTYRPAASGTFRIVCTTFDPGVTGPFTLIVRED